MTPDKRIVDIIFYLCIYTKRRGACPVTRSTNWGSRIARQVETSNVESPTPM